MPDYAWGPQVPDTPVTIPPQNPGGSQGGGGGYVEGGFTDTGQQSAFDTLAQLLNQFGLGSLLPMLQSMISDGTTDASSLMLALQGSNEWKNRFAGNEGLKALGLGVLSPSEYLAVERSYQQIMRNYGLPEGFYDDPSDFAQLIGANVSPAELQSRAQMYSDLAGREDEGVMRQLQAMGLSKGDLMAYMMDPTRAMPLIQRQYEKALLGGAALNAGLNSPVADKTLDQLVAMGVTEQQARQGYGAIAEVEGEVPKISAAQGIDFSNADMEKEIFFNNGDAARKRKRLASQERASFSGSAGTGNLTRNDAGSY